jgi:hypothetical protein
MRAGKGMSKMFLGDLVGADGDKNHFDHAKTSTSKNFLCYDLCRRPPIPQKSLGIDDNFFFTSILTAVTDPLY